MQEHKIIHCVNLPAMSLPCHKFPTANFSSLDTTIKKEMKWCFKHFYFYQSFKTDYSIVDVMLICYFWIQP